MPVWTPAPCWPNATVDILDTDTAATLHDKLAASGARLLVDTLPELLAGRIAADAAAGSEAPAMPAKISKAEAASISAARRPNWAGCMRAFDPFPGAS
jgi:methionyl-tRNA formyltransferase